MAGPTLADTKEDADEFLERVDEVQRLIEGLQAGTITPDYIDTKQQQKEQKEQNRLAVLGKRPAGRGPASGAASPSADVPAPPETEEDAEQAAADRRERAMAKVKELMASRERKLLARARYEEHVKSRDGSQSATDYTKWDIWCPDDEEDELINSVGPDTAQFRAMEKDIDERHRQMVERRQLAERCRVAGNEAYRTRQYTEALRCYQQGVDSERTNMTLHANAAMAALKISCFVQAIEHCDKVLSIAEFFQNNKHHPLCVKALQRRAEAFRALQQPARAVADLMAALELAPGSAEAAKQLAVARQEEEEGRKQRAIARAVAKGAGVEAAGAGAVVVAGGAAGEGGDAGAGEGGRAPAGFDLEKLGRLERLAASLAPPPPPPPTDASSSSGDAAAEAEGSSPGGAGGAPEASGSGQAAGAQEADGGARRGPALPVRPKGRGPAAPAAAAGQAAAGGGVGGPSPAAGDAAASVVAETCVQLRALLRDDDACCVYLRECGGLQHVATRIIKRPAPPHPAPASSAAAAAAAPHSDLAPLLLLLNDACMNDGNLKQLPALRVLPAAVAALGGGTGPGPGSDAAAAAVTLLCTAVTNEAVRPEVSKLLGAGGSLQRLVGVMAGASPAVQGVALALLGNCMVDKPTKAAMAGVWRADTVAADCFRGLLRGGPPVLAERAAVLLGNMATDAALRAEMLARDDGLVAQLLALAAGAPAAPHGSGERQAAGQQQQQQQRAPAAVGLELQRAAVTVLYNLSVDERGQRLVAEDAGGLASLYGLAAGGAQPASDRATACRAAGVVARAAKAPAGAAALLRLGAVGGLAAVAGAALEELGAGKPASGAGGDGGAGGGGGGGREASTAGLLDCAVRTLTVLTSPAEPALAAELVAAGGVGVLLRAVREGAAAVGAGLAESVLANAALCLAGVARRAEHFGLLREADAVAALIKVAYDGRGNTASKNASIALARMAHDPAMLERLRELHGIEIIYQYVKP